MRARYRLVGPAALGLSAVLAAGAASPASLAAERGAGPGAEPKTIDISTVAIPPDWAMWERQLLDRLYPAAVEFVEKYTRPDGTLIWRDAWPGMDGSDDGYESFYNFPLYYALGGPDEVLPLARRLWEAVTRQFTAYGQVHREFDGGYDWMHHGEAYTNFYFFGLADPAEPKYRERAARFAGFCIGEDPEAPNYDPQLKMFRSPLTGSRGPRLATTAEDWSTHRIVLADYPLPYDDIPGVASGRDWVDDAKFPAILAALNRRMMRGDVPLNLTSTGMVLNAFLLTGEAKYRAWIEEYVGAWIERTKANGGVLPDNIGPDGKIGSAMDGKWWGGYYGWRWPHGLFNQVESTLIGAANAFLATGDPRYLWLPRSVLDAVEKEARLDDGRPLVPHRRGDDGWRDFRPIDPAHLVYLYHVSGDPADRARIDRLLRGRPWDRLAYSKGKGDWEHAGPWLGFVEGRDPGYPLAILRATYDETLRRLETIRADRSDPRDRDVHHWQQRNPVVLEGLVQLALGAPNHVYHGGLLHCRLFYFDPERRRPGLPPDVAALVDRVAPDGLSVQLVNLHPARPRLVIVRAGAFGEHRFTTVRCGGAATAVDASAFRVRLGPGTAGRLEVGEVRYAGRPSYLDPRSLSP